MGNQSTHYKFKQTSAPPFIPIADTDEFQIHYLSKYKSEIQDQAIPYREKKLKNSKFRKKEMRKKLTEVKKKRQTQEDYVDPKTKIRYGKERYLIVAKDGVKDSKEIIPVSKKNDRIWFVKKEEKVKYIKNIFDDDSTDSEEEKMLEIKKKKEEDLEAEIYSMCGFDVNGDPLDGTLIEKEEPIFLEQEISVSSPREIDTVKSIMSETKSPYDRSNSLRLPLVNSSSAGSASTFSETLTEIDPQSEVQEIQEAPQKETNEFNNEIEESPQDIEEISNPIQAEIENKIEEIIENIDEQEIQQEESIVQDSPEELNDTNDQNIIESNVESQPIEEIQSESITQKLPEVSIVQDLSEELNDIKDQEIIESNIEETQLKELIEPIIEDNNEEIQPKESTDPEKQDISENKEEPIEVVQDNQSNVEEIKITEGKIEINSSFNFESESTELKNNETNKKILDKLAEIILKNNLIIRVEGHTGKGNKPLQHYLDMSKSRSQTICQELIKRGVSSTQLKTKGWGYLKRIPGLDPKRVDIIICENENDDGEDVEQVKKLYLENNKKNTQTKNANKKYK